jgi:hypothetical protein
MQYIYFYAPGAELQLKDYTYGQWNPTIPKTQFVNHHSRAKLA